MNRLLLQLLVALFVLPVMAQVKYSQDFENGTDDMIFLDQDKKTPNAQVSAFGPSWVVRSIEGNRWATSNSWFEPFSKADDWMITPLIADITDKTFLTWRAFSSDGQFRDQYEVRVSEGGTAVADFSKVIFTIAQETSDISVRGVSLAAYKGKSIRLAFRNISNDKFLLNIDDIKVFDAKDVDLSLESSSMKKYILKGKEETINFTIKNNGSKAITSFKAEWNDGLTTKTQTFSGINIKSFTSLDTSFTDKFSAVDADVNEILITLLDVNGGVNESAQITSRLVNHSAELDIQRKMLVEEATGTWCIWCPRGAVNMAKMREKYPNEFIGIAVHNGDPMAVAEYDEGLTALDGFGGFPSVIINRESIEDPADMETTLLNNVRSSVAPALVELKTSLTDRKISAEATVTFNTAFKGETVRLIGVLVEDGVTGSTEEYDQANIYANGANGPMGGYEKLANPVPASQMVYNEVGRELLYGFEGKDLNQGGDIKAGDAIDLLFDVDVNSNYDISKISLVLMVADEEGIIIGAEHATANSISGVNDFNEVADQISLSPNPTTDNAYLSLNIKESNDVSVKIYNQLGQITASRDYGKLSGNQVLPIITQSMSQGMYYVKLIVGGKTTTQKLIVE